MNLLLPIADVAVFAFYNGVDCPLLAKPYSSSFLKTFSCFLAKSVFTVVDGDLLNFVTVVSELVFLFRTEVQNLGS